MNKSTLLAGLGLVTGGAGLSAASLDLHFSPTEVGAPIHPFVYGQFIEHLGRCIYGGIWAEMLEDRKFYFPITEEYAPYSQFTDTAFPALGASPWEILGDANGVMMSTEAPFVGEHTPVLGQGAAIRHHDLGVEAGKAYEGYLWLKAEGARAVVTVTLATPDGQFASAECVVTHADYAKHPFLLPARMDSDAATLTIKASEGAAAVGVASLMPEDHIEGMRADTLELLRQLDAPIYRWPGGNFVSAYDWRDGIGDRDRRPPRNNHAWVGIESNDFGTDEFIRFCELLGTVPMIAANTGYGDAYSAAQWVDYCNGGADTIGGRWRMENGHADPFVVKYWCVGNEMFGPWQHGFMQLHQYTLKHNMVAKEMLAADPELELVAVGQIDQINADYDPAAARDKRTWSQGMLEECAETIDYISEHAYRGRVPWTDEGRAPLQEHVMMLKESIRDIVEKHRKLQAGMEHLDGRLIPISLDEWNYWHRDYQYGDLGCIYDHADGLGTVVALHEFYRQSDIIQIANYAQTVNVIGAIKTTRTKAEFESTGLALMLYRREFETVPIALPDTFAPYDVMAAVSEDGRRLTVSIVNPTESSVTLPFSLDGVSLPETARRWRLTAEDPLDFNTPGKPREVDIEEDTAVSLREGLFVPALTAALFEIKL